MNDYNKQMFENKAGDLEKASKKDPEALKKALEKAFERAHDIRKFEIGLYWQRALYFWGFQVAIFAAFGLLYTKEEPFLASLMAFAGLVLAIAWYYVAKGSKAWQKNWEKHIDLLEDDITGKLYKTHIGDKKEFYSVSKINKFVIGFIGVIWSIILLFPVIEKKFYCKLQCLIDCLPILFFILALLIWLVGYFCWRSRNIIPKQYDKEGMEVDKNGKRVND